MTVEPRFRGSRTGHAALRAILGTIGRNTALVVLEAAPLLDDDAPLEGSPEHELAKKKLRRHWMDFGFREASISISKTPDPRLSPGEGSHGKRTGHSRLWTPAADWVRKQGPGGWNRWPTAAD